MRLRKGILLLVAGITLLALALFTSKSTVVPAPSAEPFVLNEISRDVVAESFARKQTYSVDPKTRLLLIPHHLVAGRELASLVSSTLAPKHVLLLSPDHFFQGKRALSTTRRSFVWNKATISPDQILIDRLLATLPDTLQVQDSVFSREHGVRGLVPFFVEAWPDAQVSVMSVRTDASNKTIESLAQALHTALQADSNLLIAITIDFSHELPVYLADLHDAYAIQELQALNTNASSLVEIDSPPLFRLLATLAKLQGTTLTLHAHTNSLGLMRAIVTELGTSHVLMSSAALSTPSTTATSTSSFTFFHDPTHHIASSEDRAYRGYSHVNTSTIPFPAAFIREQTSTTTRWHAIPLRDAGDDHWRLVSDQQFNNLKTQRTLWEKWAQTHLSETSGE